jgi:preprotein translocase subunit SecY
MTRTVPPVVATWLLKRVARGNEALIGDLLEEYGRRGSAVWYWRQVLTTVLVVRSKEAVLTVAVLALYVIGGRFSVPGANADRLTLMASRAAGTPFGLFSVLTGGQLSGVTIFALGIMPYVSAALIVQVIALAWRFLTGNARPHRDVRVADFHDKPPVSREITWCVAILLCITQAIGLALFLERSSAINPGVAIVAYPGLMFRITTVLTLTAGTAGLMLISDQISRRGIGNGMFLVFLAGIVAGLSGTLLPLITGQADPIAVVSYTALHVTIAGVVSHGYRRAFVPVEHA